MLNITDEVKNLYNQIGAAKELELYFPSISLTISSANIVAESLELLESICSEEKLIFGLCEASQIKLTLYNIEQDLTGIDFIATHVIDDNRIPLGSFRVDTCKKQDDLKYKDIVGYDIMTKFDNDVTQWYNGLFQTGAEAYTLAQFRASLLNYLSVTEDSNRLPLINDQMLVTKTIDPSELSAREVIFAIEEANGCFGHINRENKFTHIVLGKMHDDYPENDYPTNDYPIDEPYNDYVGKDDYSEVKFAEYRVIPIDKIHIRQEENDVGCIYGTGSNVYVIQGNFLMYGKDALSLNTIAENISQNIFNRGYRPYTTIRTGKPYIEAGDFVKLNADDTTVGYVFVRTMKGIKSLRDEYMAKGAEKQTQEFNANKEIIQLKGRSTKIEKSVDSVKVQVSDLDTKLSGEINVLAGQVVLKVDTNGNIGYIMLDGNPDTDLTSITLKASTINFNGYAEFDVNGGLTSINGSVLKTGTVVADTVRADWVYAGNLNAGQITSGTISGDKIYGGTISGASLTSSPEIYTQSITVQGTSTQTIIDGGFIECVDINVNGSDVITTGSIGQQSVNYASSAGSASYASSAGSVSGMSSSQITAVDTGYGNIDFSGFDNAAGVQWVDSNYQKIGASDVRLKYDINSLDDIPDELFYSFKPKRFKYKTSTYGPGIFFGLIAQELESAFQAYGLNPYDYDLIEVKDVSTYTDDGFYVNDATHRIHYNNFIGWIIKIIQSQNERLKKLESGVA